MSTESMASYSRMTFPALEDVDLGRSSLQEQARGHAAGYASGLRAAAEETERLRARLTAEHEAALAVGRQQVARSVRSSTVRCAAWNSR